MRPSQYSPSAISQTMPLSMSLYSFWIPFLPLRELWHQNRIRNSIQTNRTLFFPNAEATLRVVSLLLNLQRLITYMIPFDAFIIFFRVGYTPICNNNNINNWPHTPNGIHHPAQRHTRRQSQQSQHTQRAHCICTTLECRLELESKAGGRTAKRRRLRVSVCVSA